MKKILCVLLCCGLLLPLSVAAFAADASADSPFADSAFFTCGEYRIHYRVREAQPEKGRILMIHGFAMSTSCWEPLADRLAESGYTCVLADLPDFGYSTRENAGMKKLPREDILHALMDALGGEWYVAGHSMGGYVALAIAEKYPDSVKNVLLYGTAGNGGVSAQRRAFMASDGFVAVMGPFMELLGRSDLIVRLFLRLALADRAYAGQYDLHTITAPLNIPGTGAGALYSFSMLPETDYDAVREMPPILFVNGDRDVVIRDRARAALRAALPAGSADIVVQGGGHLFIENFADETARITLAFLAACEDGAGR